jgi:hypothetical protein
MTFAGLKQLLKAGTERKEKKGHPLNYQKCPESRESQKMLQTIDN